MDFDAEGLLDARIEPLDRLTVVTYDTTGDRRSRGNATRVEVLGGIGEANGSSETLTTETTYDLSTNLPSTITDPRGAVIT